MAETKKVYTQEEFEKMYLQLCALTGWQHGAIPEFKHMPDIGGSLITVKFVILPYIDDTPKVKESLPL